MFQAIVDFLKDFGPLGLAIHSFLDAVIFPIPAFFTQVSLSLLNPSFSLWLATIGFISCLIGTPIGYLIGKFMGNSILYRFVKKDWIDKATNYFQTKGEVAILFGAFTPIPFKVFTILSGALQYPLWRLMGYAAIGRAAKFYVVGLMIFMYGQAAEKMVGNASIYILLGSIPLIIIYLIVRKRLRLKKELKEKQQLKEAEATESKAIEM